MTVSLKKTPHKPKRKQNANSLNYTINKNIFLLRYVQHKTRTVQWILMKLRPNQKNTARDLGLFFQDKLPSLS